MLLEFNICLAIFFILWLIIDAESVLNLGLRLNSYLDFGLKFLQILPSVVRMFIVRAYMLWKIKRQMKASFNIKLP